jgi:phosphoenolpyruvate-protein phosphotransferase/dihydroxyacetone kinase phosphotransfer subunit
VVGIVVVSHSEMLADGVVRLAREMGGPELALVAAGGIEDSDADDPVLGTDAERVRAAIERVMSDDGVLVLMDLGSALMSAEFAIEMLGETAGPVRLSPAPLVEGAVAAAVAAAGGACLDDVAAEARGAMAMKAAQLGDGSAQDPRPEAPQDGSPELDVGDEGMRVELPVRNAGGLHARPAARFVETVRGFDAEVRVAKHGDNAPVSARSLTNVVSLGARAGDSLIVTARGPQAQDALRALRELADSGFGDGIGTGALSGQPPAGAPSGAVRPPAVPPADAAPPQPGSVLTGVAASGGVAIGPAHRLGGSLSPPPDRPAEDPGAERARLDQALVAARRAVEHDRQVVGARGAHGEAEIFDAHLALLDDAALLEPAHDAIAAGATAERAWYDAAEQVATRFRALTEPLLQERATDVLDIAQRVLAQLGGDLVGAGAPEGIVIADELTPAGAAGLDPSRALGIATARGSATAHAAILARGLGLPAVVGLGPEVLGVPAGTVLLLDGDAGTVTVAPAASELEGAAQRGERRRRRVAADRGRAHEPGAMASGERIEVFANLGAAGEAARAVELGAEGVGLLRTEFLFLDRHELPDEEEQVQTLREIAVALDGRPLVVRTLDAGADKPMWSLPMPPEANPFLGVRGIRLALQRPEVLATQFRAILRVAAEYPVKAMLPMVATLREVTAARGELERARADTGVTCELELGIMVEVPAAALGAARLAPHVDFFSLGTNDLTQYTMAAERGDARLAWLLAGPQPAVLRLVDATVRAAQAHGRWVGVCGELAGDPAAAVLLAGLGVGELSMASGLIPQAKAALRGVALPEARAAARAALDADDAETARGMALALL